MRILWAVSMIQFIWSIPAVAASVPGVAVHYLPASSGRYIGSPGLVSLGSGVYLATHDEFGQGSVEWQKAVSHVYRSDDAGISWRRIQTVEGLFWASLFTQGRAVYLLGTDKHHGNAVILRSEDRGETWTRPTDSQSGLLLEGQYHTAPVPVVVHAGRIWRAMEDAMGGTEWGRRYRALMMSAPVDADLLDRRNWTFSNVLARNPDWLDGQFNGWLEGNAVVAPEGKVVNILRVACLELPEKAAMIRLSADGKTATFDPALDFINLPGGTKKFTIRFDPVSQHYWTLCNYIPQQHQGVKHPGAIRNTLALARSADLRNWEIRSILLYHPDMQKHGFQYIDWLFEGDDIIALSRTAYDDGKGGARNFHDANFLTFHRFKGFRELSQPDIGQAPDAWAIQMPPQKSPSEHLVARWCFETGALPTDDTAPAGKNADRLTVSGPVRFEDGLAKLPANVAGVALKAESSDDLSPAAEMTLWMRFKLKQKPSSFMSLVDKRTFNPEQRSYGLFITPNRGSMHLFGIGGQVSSSGIAAGSMALTEPKEMLPLDLWVQAAMVVQVEQGMLVTEWYYRTEDTDRRNPWRLVDKACGGWAIHRSEVPLIIGNDANLKALASELWIDEVRLYNRALNESELNYCWALFGAYPDIPEKVPGVVIDHSAAKTGVYLGSPGLVILPDGAYIAKSDEYGPQAAGRVSRLYRSEDRGQTWNRIGSLEMFWSNLFVHEGVLYKMGTSAGHGQGRVVIRKSLDGGYNWTNPVDENSGLLWGDLSYHTAPMPTIIHNGRLWRTMEDERGLPNQWGTRFRAFMMSAPIDADLLKASSWTSSDRLGYNPEWLDGRFRGWLEGNAVIGPDGGVVNILRADYRPEGGKAAIIHYSADGKQSFFDPEKDFIDFPGGAKKFVIRHDERSGLYWALSSVILPKHASGNLERARALVRRNQATVMNPAGENAFSNPERMRNTLALMSSKNLRNWTIRDVVLYHPEVNRHGFQYPDWQFDGADIIFVSRTAYDDGLGGADNQHNANYLTFHRISNFRNSGEME